MKLLNFSHPIMAEQLEQLEQRMNQNSLEVIEIPVQFDMNKPFEEQARALINKVDLSSKAWQSEPLIINLPSLNYIATLLLAEIHGRAGYFPTIIRMKAKEGVIRTFEVAELLNLQTVRDNARFVRG